MGASRGKWLSLKASIRVIRRGVRLYAVNRSPRALFQAFSFFARKFLGQSPPIRAFIAATYRCQCRCPHCYAGADTGPGFQELTTEETLSLLDQLRTIGALQVVFTGGEPLLRPDIFELIAHAHGIGLLTRLNTNAHKLDAECASKLKKAGLDQCGISVDFVDSESHDRFRGLAGLHAKALKAFDLLRAEGIQRRMYVAVTHAKLASGLERYIKLGEELKADSVFFSTPYAVGRWDKLYEEVLSDQEMDSIRRLQECPSVAMEFYTAQANCCAYDKTLLSISAGGDVSLCPAIPYCIGNVRNEPLAAIWARRVSAVKLESRGKCPLNAPQERVQIEAYCAALAKRDSV